MLPARPSLRFLNPLAGFGWIRSRSGCLGDTRVPIGCVKIGSWGNTPVQGCLGESGRNAGAWERLRSLGQSISWPAAVLVYILPRQATFSFGGLEVVYEGWSYTGLVSVEGEFGGNGKQVRRKPSLWSSSFLKALSHEYMIV